MSSTETHTQHIEEAATATEVAAEAGLRLFEIAPFVLIGLLVCPPLAILAVVVIAPLLVMGLVLGLVAAVLAFPYLLVQHFRNPHAGHMSFAMQRLRHAGRALLDLAPHRIVADTPRRSALAHDR